MTTDSARSSATAASSLSGSTRPKIAGGPSPETPFPIKMSGTVIKGFGRGSKDLGIPTANLPEEAIAAQEQHMPTGIYYGWAQVVVKTKSDADKEATAVEAAPTIGESASSSTSSLSTHCPATIYPMVMSLGWNPFYKNEKKSAEVHIMHNFHRDFYGDDLRIVVLGYIRPELDYTTLEALIEDINIDIEVAHRSLERPDYASFKGDPLFLQ
ncbi:riboflavin kinase [Dissophora globulifera]|uniref:Riboflavin kinase n=1 Tax=Dissophora globulifera TaxID=979702 RepID=A0A9P6RSH3_9FUNG|nr:riboflavin kinase [Dissophora globulifera]